MAAKRAPAPVKTKSAAKKVTPKAAPPPAKPVKADKGSADNVFATPPVNTQWAAYLASNPLNIGAGCNCPLCTGMVNIPVPVM